MRVIRKKTTTPRQFEILVDFLTKHRDMAVGFAGSPEAKAQRRHMWNRLTYDLNQQGPPVRNSLEWKSIWSDYKYNLKRKLAAHLKLVKRKNCSKRLTFNKTEQTVINLLGMWDKHTNSVKYYYERKPTSAQKTPNPLSVVADDDWEASNCVPTQNTMGDDQIVEEDNKDGILLDENVLEEPTETPMVEEEDTFDQETESLKLPTADEQGTVETINASLPAILSETLLTMQKTQQAILAELRESNRYKRQALDIKDQQLQLEKEKMDETKLQDYEANKIAYIKIELKRKELELYELKIRGLCTQCNVKNEAD